MGGKGKAPETAARLRKRPDNASSHYSGSVTSENTQNDEHVAEIFQSPVSGFMVLCLDGGRC
jgi:dolichyl-phosphate-mannose-protein mannosyltransferase